jgi:hypothetical protein
MASARAWRCSREMSVARSGVDRVQVAAVERPLDLAQRALLVLDQGLDLLVGGAAQDRLDPLLVVVEGAGRLLELELDRDVAAVIEVGDRDVEIAAVHLVVQVGAQRGVTVGRALRVVVVVGRLDELDLAVAGVA